MSTIAEIQSAIEKLPSQDQEKVRQWVVSMKPGKLSVFERLKEVAGTAVGLPEDLAENHDHYLHGVPKQAGK